MLSQTIPPSGPHRRLRARRERIGHERDDEREKSVVAGREGACGRSTVVRVCRKNKSIDWSCRRRRVNGVVPLAVEGVGLEVHASELLVRDAAALRVVAGVEAAAHGEAGLRRRRGNEVHDDLVGDRAVCRASSA